MPTPEEIREMEHKHVKMSYNKINELIYAGNNLCCQTHFEEELLAKGITADISLELERLDNPTGVKYFFWFPWEEETAPTTELVILALQALDNLSKQDIKTYVHCKNGHGRTSTFLGSYFIYKHHLTTEEALREVRKKRPSMHLNDVQKDFLRKFEKIIKNIREA